MHDDDYTIRTEKPWGYYEVLSEDASSLSRWLVKRIGVNPKARLSLQSHELREEFWVVEDGYGYVELEISGELVRIDLDIGEHIFIEKNQKHRLCAGENGVIVLEYQYGECAEDDIVRYQDDYGRL